MVATRSERRRRWFVLRYLSGRRRVATSPAAAAVNPSPSLIDRWWRQWRRDCGVPANAKLNVVADDGRLRVQMPLVDPFLLIGTDSRCGLQLQGPDIAPRHYALFWLGGRLFGVNLVSQSDRGARVPATGWLVDGQRLTLGRYQLQLSGLSPVAAPRFRDGLQISLRHTTEADFTNRAGTVPIKRWLTLIGRHADCDVPLPDRGVAERQAALVHTPSSLWLVNLSMAAPPLMGGQSIAWTALDPLDEFTILRRRFRIEAEWPMRVPLALPPSAASAGVPSPVKVEA